MNSKTINSSVRVNYCLAVEPTQVNEPAPYHLHFRLHPKTQALPFEPFLTLLRREYADRSQQLADVLSNTCLSLRLQRLVKAWVLEQPLDDLEPTNPAEYQFEQNAIRQALYEIIQLAFNDTEQRILIENAEYLPVSSSKLLQRINSSANARLHIDLLLQPMALKDWWPEDQIQRQLKHCFLTSSRTGTAQTPSALQISIGQRLHQVDQLLYWAAKLYCGGELRQLVTHSALNELAHSEDQRVQRLCQSVRATSFMGRDEEAARLLGSLEQVDLSAVKDDLIPEVFETRYLAQVWCHHYAEAHAIARNYAHWCRHYGTEKQLAYSQYLVFFTACFIGNYRYHSDTESLQRQLHQLGWYNLYHCLRSNLWFDHQYLITHSDQLIQHCQAAMEYAQQQKNEIAASYSAHHLCIVHQHSGNLDEALNYINIAIEKSRALFSRTDTYNCLNGKAYLLTLMGRFADAVVAVEQAFDLVLAEGNFEQICTTLYNAAFAALLSGHFNAAIKLIDDIFSIMQMRGLNRTRFRTTYDMRTLQAIAILFAGEVPLAQAVYQISEPDKPKTMESRLMHDLMMTINQFTNQHSDPLDDQFTQLLKDYSDLSIPVLPLFIQRVQWRLYGQLYGTDHQYSRQVQLSAIEKAKPSIRDLAVDWFQTTQRPSMPLDKRFEALKAIQSTQREAQIDLLRTENALLNIALELESGTFHCQSPDDLFAECLTQLHKLAPIVDAEIISGNPEPDAAQQLPGAMGLDGRYSGHQFRFTCGETPKVLKVTFDAATEAYNDQLIEWLGRLTDQLQRASESILQRNLSEKMAYHDHLTGLGNRAAFEQFFAEQRLTSGDVLTVAFIDLNRFKTINDLYGHLAGDAILQSFARHLTHSIRESDLAFRIGGDEFFVVFWNARNDDVQQVMEQKLLSFFTRSRRVSDPHQHLYPKIGCSIGLLEIESEQGGPIDRRAIIHQADALMYRAKQQYTSTIESDRLKL